MNVRWRFKPVSILALSAVLVGLGIVNLLDRASWQLASDGIVWVEAARGLEVGHVTSPQSEVDLEPGDLLLSVNVIPVGGLDDLIQVRDFLAKGLPPGTPALYRVQDRAGEAAEVPVPLFLEPALGAIDVVLTAMALGFLAIGLFIFLRNWNAVGALHFYLICLVAFVALLYRYSGRTDTFDLIVYGLDAAALLLLPPLFAHFCLYFPKPLRRLENHRWLASAAYLPALLLGALHTLWILGWLAAFGLPRVTFVRYLIDQVELFHFVAFFAGASLLLAYKRTRLRTPVQRQQMKWITRGSLYGVAPFALLYGIPYLAGWPISLWMELSVLTLLLVPLGFGYAITRYRLMDVDLIFKRSAAYLLATSALLGIYIGLVVVAGRVIELSSGGPGLLTFGLGALLVAVLFAPLKSRIQERIERHFYKERYDYRQSFAEFSRTLSTETSLPALSRKITERVRQTLGVDKVGIFLRREPAQPHYDLYQGAAGDESDVVLEAADSVLRDLGQEPQVLLPSLASDEVARCRRQLGEMDFGTVQLLEVHDRIIGFLALGHRPGGQWLSSEDLQLIETLAGYAAMALDNALLFRSLESNAAQLAELKVYADSVIESITVGVAVLSPLGEITIWNSRMEAIHGLPAARAVGRNVRDVFPGELLSVLTRFLRGSSWEVSERGRIYKTRLETAKGESRMVELTVAPLVSADDLSSGTLLVLDDVTEKTQLENQLLQSEKLSSIGLFAAGVAHEVNTPLAGISSYAQMLLEDAAKDDPSRELLERIEQQSFRASEIVNNLLKFARVSENDFQKVNLNSLMLETVSLLDHSFEKSKVEVDLDLDPSLPATIGSGGKLQQVFMNLFLNARDAMPGGGELQVRTFRRDSRLVVQIRDEGEGISEENVKRIYDPFFTTKGVGKGTGLGLAVSYGIIQEHSGQISVQSEPGKGTVFTVELPLERVQ